MDEIVTLFVLSLAMLIGCYVAGSIPLAFNLSEDRLQLITVLGAGLLVGTALAVIIPEGVNALYSSALEAVETLHTQSKTESDTPAGHSKDGDHEHTHYLEVHHYIGISLVLGFVFMLLIDQLGHSHSSSSRQSQGDSEAAVTQPKDSTKITATLGLVVHAAADGIALGAAASTSHKDTEIIVFIAIMLHKAPAAFGLVSFLLHEGLQRNRIRKHLFVFALAAPLLAVVTYFGLSQGGKEALSQTNATGITMLFSAGTFLYVATVHVLPEVAHMPSSSDSAERSGFKCTHLTALVLGALFPLLLGFSHHH